MPAQANIQSRLNLENPDSRIHGNDEEHQYSLVMINNGCRLKLL